ncbi:hypothetical protein [Pseudomonas syringae]|uniref:hypothetical protein n=1 Tax=Pseudomonas syringae TaxID=317 RepID=UPI001110DB18|nr:hypothetical protein [Pseudomonas syringae]
MDSLYSLYSWMVKGGWLKGNPVALVKKPEALIDPMIQRFLPVEGIALALRRSPFGDSMTIRTLIPQASGHRFHGHPDTFRQAATQDYSILSTSFFEAKRSSWSVYPCVKSERYYA